MNSYQKPGPNGQAYKARGRGNLGGDCRNSRYRPRAANASTLSCQPGAQKRLSNSREASRYSMRKASSGSPGNSGSRERTADVAPEAACGGLVELRSSERWSISWTDWCSVRAGADRSDGALPAPLILNLSNGVTMGATRLPSSVTWRVARG
jgi:hypothetical protein